jgi:hypothetical protein
VSTLSAQQEAPAKQHEWKVAIGDSVMIKRECQQYLTGEKPSVWVWDKVHTVRQLGTKRFPEGVLLMNIYSWICEDCLIPVNGVAQEAAAKASEEQADEKAAAIKAGKVKPDPVAKPGVKPGTQPSQSQQAAQAGAAEQAQESEATQAQKQAVKPAQTQAQAAEQAAAEAQAAEEAESVEGEEPKAEEPAAEQAAEEAAEETVAEEDSIASEPVKQNYHRFTIGVRGGAASLMHHAQKANWTCGGDVVLDLQYAHYWAKDGRPVDLGIITGVGLGYAQSGLKVDRDSTAFTTGGVNYTVLAKGVKETDHALQLEVPLMFSLIHDNGLFFNIGPKFMIPVYSPYKQTVDQNETHISAFFPTEGITVIDKTVTGKYTGQQPTASNGIQFNVNVMLTAEIGYEWILKSGNSLGLGAYANYSVFNTFKNTPSAVGLFNLTAPTETSIATLDVLSATKTYADKLGYFDAGIKLAYHFNFPKKKQFKDSKLF